MPFRNVMQSLGDAISGVDREGAYRKGMAERADIDQTEAQTEAAMALARDRQLDSEKKERERAAAQALRERQADLNDPGKVSTMDLMESGFGAEYSAAQQGRGHAQDYLQKETIGTPSQGMGDEVFTPEQTQEALRVAAMEAQAPAAAVASRRPGAQQFEMVLQPDGSSAYVPRQEAAGQTVGGRPPAPRAGTGDGAGGLSTSAQSLIYRQAVGVFGGTYDPLTGRFTGLDRDSTPKMQRLASRASQIVKEGGDIATAVDQALAEAKQLTDTGGIQPQWGDALEDDVPADVPEGSKLVGHTNSGVPVYQTPTGERLIAE